MVGFYLQKWGPVRLTDMSSCTELNWNSPSPTDTLQCKLLKPHRCTESSLPVAQGSLNIIPQINVHKDFFLVHPNERCWIKGLWKRELNLFLFSVVLFAFSALMFARFFRVSGFFPNGCNALGREKVTEANLLTTYTQYVLPKSSS